MVFSGLISVGWWPDTFFQSSNHTPHHILYSSQLSHILYQRDTVYQDIKPPIGWVLSHLEISQWYPACNPCSIAKNQKLQLLINHTTRYEVGLSASWELRFQSPNQPKRTLNTARIIFKNQIMLKCGARCKGKSDKLKSAMNGVVVDGIKSISINQINVQFTLRFLWDNVDYTFSVPTWYFTELVAKSTWKEVWFTKNAVEEIYGEAQNSLTKEDKKTYDDLESYITHLVITLK